MSAGQIAVRFGATGFIVILMVRIVIVVIIIRIVITITVRILSLKPLLLLVARSLEDCSRVLQSEASSHLGVSQN